MGEARIVDWSELGGELAPNGVSRRRIPGAGAELVRVEIPAGVNAPRHSHEHEQFVQVLSGVGVIETEAGRREFGPGSVFHFPPGVWHTAEIAADTVLIETNLADLAVIDR